MRQNKLIILAITGLILTACFRSSENTNTSQPIQAPEVADTGKVIELSNALENRVVSAQPGDKIHLILSNQANFQWSLREPITQNLLGFRDHLVTNQVTEWNFKVLEAGESLIRFEFENALRKEKPAATYRAKIVSAATPSELKNIFVDAPNASIPKGKVFTLQGFARLSKKEIFYSLKDENGVSLAQGFVKLVNAKATTTDFIYFEKSIYQKTTNAKAAVLHVFAKNPTDQSEIDAVDLKLSVTE